MFLNLGFQEIAVVGVVAVLLFGKRLPEVARTLGGTYRDFRKGLSEMQAQLRIDETDVSRTGSSNHYEDDFDDYDEPVAPKFEPPESEPTQHEPQANEVDSVSSGDPESPLHPG